MNAEKNQLFTTLEKRLKAERSVQHAENPLLYLFLNFR